MGNFFSSCKNSGEKKNLDETIEENKPGGVNFDVEFTPKKKKEAQRRATGAGGLLGKTPVTDDNEEAQDTELGKNLSEADKNATENAKPIAAEEPRALSPTPAGGQVSAEELTGAEEQQSEEAPAQEAQENAEEAQAEEAKEEAAEEVAEETAVEKAASAEAVAEEAAPAEEAAAEEAATPAEEADAEAPAEVTEAAAEEVVEETAAEETTAAEAETAVEPAESQE